MSPCEAEPEDVAIFDTGYWENPNADSQPHTSLELEVALVYEADSVRS